MAIKITGGLGRIVAALPALTASKQLVVTHGWDELYTMTNLNRIESESSFVGNALKDEDVIEPEPYHLADYRKGQFNMIEAFNKLLGTDSDVHGLIPNVDNLSHWIQHFAQVTELPLVIIQPKASSRIRDMHPQNVHNAIEAFKEAGFFPVIVGDEVEYEHEAYQVKQTSITDFVSLIALGAFFVGGDSSGMHIAKALGKTGFIYLTSTAGIKYYPENFIEFRHPANTEAIETPRLFRGEQVNHKANETFDFTYVVSKEDLLQFIAKPEQSDGEKVKVDSSVTSPESKSRTKQKNRRVSKSKKPTNKA